MDPSVPYRDPAGSTIEPLIWVIPRDPSRGEKVELFLKEHDLLHRYRMLTGCTEALSLLSSNNHPNVILVDICDACHERLAMITRMRAQSPATRIIVIAKSAAEETIIEAVCAGATGYLVDGSPPEQIIDAIRSILAGGTPMEASVAHKVLAMIGQLGPPRHAYSLTDREKDVLRLVAEGRSKKEIAEALFLSYFTVDTHLKNIYEKLHVHSQAAAVSKAFKENLLFAI
jgi:DNA-binding NarL/FixJ family response regulator